MWQRPSGSDWLDFMLSLSVICKILPFSFFFVLYKFELQAPDEEFEEFLRQQVGELCPGDQNKVEFMHFMSM